MEEEEEEEECPICFERISFLTSHKVLSCGHSFCSQGCLLKSLKAMQGRCCLCRGWVVDCYPRLDVLVPTGYPVILDLSAGKHAGMMLVNHKCGVEVKKLTRGDEGCTTFRIGDVLTHMNGVPVLSHEHAVSIIQHATLIGGEVHTEVVPRPTGCWAVWRT
jgi:hypothetical protein